MSATTLDNLPDRTKLPGLAAEVGAFVAYGVTLAMYTAIVVITMATLALVLTRQANTVNYNALVATLEQRDLLKARLPQVLDRLRKERGDYAELLRQPLDCFPTAGAMSRDPGAGRRTGSASSTLAAGARSLSCEELGNVIRSHANELRLAEDQAMFKMANSDAYYISYVDGITQKMPEIIPALQILDSRSKWIKSWARSPFELMEMFLLVSMGILGGMVNVTRWLIDSNARRPSLFAYFYRPAAGGAIALGAFVVFKASQLIIVGPTQEGGSSVTASVFLLAALGLISGFCADKTLRQIEKAADSVLRSEIPGGQETSAKVVQPAAHLQMVERASNRHVGFSARKLIRPVSSASASELGVDASKSHRSPDAAAG